MAAGDIQHIGRLGDAGEAGAQLGHDRLAFGNRRAEMRGAFGEIAVVQIIGLHPGADQRAEQGFQRVRIGVHAFQQHGLRQERDAGAVQAAEGG